MCCIWGRSNDRQALAWRKSIAVFEEGGSKPRTLWLFPEDRCEGLLLDTSIVRLKLSRVRLCRPRVFGSCWLALMLWQELRLDRFWEAARARGGIVLFVLVAYRLLAPGSEWHLHREWFERSALSDLLESDGRPADIHTLYRCHDRLPAIIGGLRAGDHRAGDHARGSAAGLGGAARQHDKTPLTGFLDRIERHTARRAASG